MDAINKDILNYVNSNSEGAEYYWNGNSLEPTLKKWEEFDFGTLEGRTKEELLKISSLTDEALTRISKPSPYGKDHGINGVARQKDVKRIMGLVDSLILSSQNAHSEIRKLEKRIEALEAKPHRSNKGIKPSSKQDLSVDAISKIFIGE